MSASGIPVMGVCRFCGCTDADPCRLPDGETCGWVNRLRTVCGKLSCQHAWAAERKRDLGRIRRELAKMRREIRARGRRKGRAPGKPKG